MTLSVILPFSILILSTALFFFYLQATCGRILAREFEQDHSIPVVKANRLVFPSLRRAIEEFGTPPDYARLRVMLKCDYVVLTYLLRNAAKVKQGFSREERFLMIYFRLLLFFLAALHQLRAAEEPVILKLTAILRYFANVVGQRVRSVRFGDLWAADLLTNN